MRNNQTRGVAIAALAVMISTAGVASANPTGPSYNYVDIGYVDLDLDGGGSIDGYGLTGSFALAEQFHIVADYIRVSEGILSADVTTLAGGWNMPLNPTTDFVARLGFVRAGARVTGFGSDSDNGWMVQGGIRSMVAPQFELNAFVTHTDVSGSDTSIGVGAVWHFTNNFGLSGGFDFSDGDRLSRLGVRFSF
ncbi:MAG: porin family protein [Xanthomonadaceae bacterium]|nr:porin family protein [Xanthomonadaceae bacterium]